MYKQKVLIEVLTGAPEAFSLYSAAALSLKESESQIEKFAKSLPGLGVDVDPAYPPLPMFFGLKKPIVAELHAFAGFAAAEESPDRTSSSIVVTAEVDAAKLSDLNKKKNLRIYPASRLHLQRCGCADSAMSSVEAADVQGAIDEDAMDMDLMDLADNAGGTDCRPFRPGVSVSAIRQLLGVRHVWSQGFAGQNVIVALVDEGVNGQRYPCDWRVRAAHGR